MAKKIEAVGLALIVAVLGAGLAAAWLYRGLIMVFYPGCLGFGLVFGLAGLALAATVYGLYSLGYWRGEVQGELED